MQNILGIGRWKSLKALIVSLPIAVAFATPASATLLLEGTESSNQNAAGELALAQSFAEDVWGPLDPLFLLCKDDVLDEGAFCGLFSLDGSFTPGTSTQYTTSWDLTGEDLSLYVIVVKAANPQNYYVVQDIPQLIMGGPETLDSPTGQGISHVAFYGLEGVRVQVPEPTTLLLLGLGLAGLGFAKRRLH